MIRLWGLINIHSTIQWIKGVRVTNFDSSVRMHGEKAFALHSLSLSLASRGILANYSGSGAFGLVPGAVFGYSGWTS